MAISTHSNEQSLVSCNKRPSQEHLMGLLRYYFSTSKPHFMNTPSQSHSFYEHSKSVTLELSCQPEKSI